MVCAYWDYNANEDAGGWRTDGCVMTSSWNATVVCKCNHLSTNFAVLIVSCHKYIEILHHSLHVSGPFVAFYKAFTFSDYILIYVKNLTSK